MWILMLSAKLCLLQATQPQETPLVNTEMVRRYYFRSTVILSVQEESVVLLNIVNWYL